MGQPSKPTPVVDDTPMPKTNSASELAPSPQVNPPSEAPGVPTAASWEARYSAGDSLMRERRFVEAAALYAELADIAATETARTRAQEAMRIATFLETTFGRSIVTNASEGARTDRTTGELANLYVSSILYGLGSGIAVGVHTNPDSPAGAVLPALGLAGASAGLVAVLDTKLELGYGVPQSISTGMWLGFYEGFALTFYHFASTTSENELSDQTISKLIWGSATLGAVAGGVVGQKWGTTPGRASLLGTNGLWGGLTLGLLALGISDGSGDSDEGFFGAAAIGIAGGALLGGWQGRDEAPSLARVRFLDLGGLSGGLLLGGLALAADPDREESIALASGFGIAAGYAVAYFATRGMEPDSGGKRDVALISPTFAPTTDGTGLTFGLAGTL